jgi:hypothetical protein
MAGIQAEPRPRNDPMPTLAVDDRLFLVRIEFDPLKKATENLPHGKRQQGL